MADRVCPVVASNYPACGCAEGDCEVFDEFGMACDECDAPGHRDAQGWTMTNDGRVLCSSCVAATHPTLEVPEGWHLVPGEPTTEMECAPDHEDCPTPDAARAIYRAMLKKAPASPLDVITVEVITSPSTIVEGSAGLVDRLREPALDDVPVRICRLMDQAADEIDRLRAALRPFARVADMEIKARPNDSVMVNVSRCREAREALATAAEVKP